MKLEILPRDKNESTREYALRILMGNLVRVNVIPGTALSEQEIANELNVSRTPVREAFIRLAHDDLLEILPQKGTYVAKIDLEHVAESIFLRETMEHAVMQLACQEFSEESLEKMQNCLDLQEICVQKDDYIRFFELDSVFHGMIYKTCGKKRIWKMIESMSLNYNRVRMLNLKNGYYELPRLLNQHIDILQAIEDSDWPKCEAVSNIHINKALNDIEELKNRYPVYFKR